MVAADASGNFIVVWSSYGQDGSQDGIFGQRYDSAGGVRGDEFRVNSYTTSKQVFPSVASDADGNFVVVWSSNQDGSAYGVFGQRYDSEGVAQGGEFRVNSFTTGFQQSASVGSDATGNFVVVWSSPQDGNSYGLFGRRYDSAGVAQGNEFRVNSYTPFAQVDGAVAIDASGNFVVVWTSFFQDGNSNGVFGQRYDSGGVAQGDEFRVNTYTTGAQQSASVATDASGNFVIAWMSYGQDGHNAGIFGQRYDSAGVAQGDEFRVNSFTTLSQQHPSVASDASGNFVVAWDSVNQDGSGFGVFGQRYDSAGVAQGNEFQVNSFTTQFQTFPSVEATGTNQFVVAWASYGQDGSGYGVFGQRFDFGGGTPTLHSGDLDGRSSNSGANWKSRIRVEVHDSTHALLSGALVTFSVSAGVGTKTCTTGAAGSCNVSAVVPDSVPSLTYSITAISKAGFAYAPGNNHDPDGSSDGTTIVVLQ